MQSLRCPASGFSTATRSRQLPFVSAGEPANGSAWLGGLRDAHIGMDPHPDPSHRFALPKGDGDKVAAVLTLSAIRTNRRAPSWFERPHVEGAVGSVAAVLLHTALLSLLLQHEPVQQARLPPAAPMMVSIIAPSTPQAEAPKPLQKPLEPAKLSAETPKTRPVAKPLKRLPIVAAPSKTPS